MMHWSGVQKNESVIDDRLQRSPSNLTLFWLSTLRLGPFFIVVYNSGVIVIALIETSSCYGFWYSIHCMYTRVAQIAFLKYGPSFVLGYDWRFNSSDPEYGVQLDIHMRYYSLFLHQYRVPLGDELWPGSFNPSFWGHATESVMSSRSKTSIRLWYRKIYGMRDMVP